MSEDNEKLQELRNKIDVIDYQIHDLINQRAKIALEVGKTKLQAGGFTTDFYRPEREKQILDRISEHNKGPLAAQAIHKIFRAIMQECLTLQEENNKRQK